MVDYLIIAPSKFHKDLEELREHRGKDHTVLMVDPESLYALAPKGSRREETIQGFVRDIYQRTNGELKYLLLVGDDTAVNLPEEIPVGKYGGEILSDAFYGDIEGDKIPEIAVGRLPASNSKSVQDFVANVLDYENGTKSQTLQNRLSFYAGRGDFGIVEDLLLESFVYALIQRRMPQSYHLDLHYDAEGSIFNTGRSFLEMLNEGAFAMTYMGHGAPRLLATEPEFGSGDLESVGIKNGLPLLNLMAKSVADSGCLQKMK